MDLNFSGFRDIFSRYARAVIFQWLRVYHKRKERKIPEAWLWLGYWDNALFDERISDT